MDQPDGIDDDDGAGAAVSVPRRGLFVSQLVDTSASFKRFVDHYPCRAVGDWA